MCIDFFFFKQKTAYEMRISDWSSDVCSSDLTPLQGKFADMPWRKPRDYAADLNAWQDGRTGIPIVDAGMRELWTTGWMHNRVRMINASFLTKTLLIQWQAGERWFRVQLPDADLANNTIGRQSTTGRRACTDPHSPLINPAPPTK